jgi:hypothetical protein
MLAFWCLLDHLSPPRTCFINISFQKICNHIGNAIMSLWMFQLLMATSNHLLSIDKRNSHLLRKAELLWIQSHFHLFAHHNLFHVMSCLQVNILAIMYIMACTFAFITSVTMVQIWHHMCVI